MRLASVMGICVGLVGPKKGKMLKNHWFYCYFVKGHSGYGSESPPQTNGFEAILGMEILLCTRCWQKSAFENVLPALAGSTFS